MLRWLQCMFPPLGNPLNMGAPLPWHVLAPRIDYTDLAEMMRDKTRNVILVNSLGRVYSGMCQIEGSNSWWCGNKPYTMAMPPTNVPSATYFERWNTFPGVELPILDPDKDIVVTYCAHRR